MTPLSEENRKLVERVLPGNNSLTNFTDFRCSHEDLAALLGAAHKEAYQQGWSDREDDLIAGVNRIAPAPPVPSEAPEGGGWVLVPREPTAEMLDAVCDRRNPGGRAAFRGDWHAMIQAIRPPADEPLSGAGEEGTRT